MKGVALVGDYQIHNADHLAPIAAIMDVPLMFLNESDSELCKELYPDIKIETPPYEKFNADYMIGAFDVLFLSDLWPQAKFEQTFGELEKTCRKRLRHVFCPHGYSDKSYYFKDCVYEDITLVYGQNMLDLLKECKVDHLLKRYVLTGNYRWTYYQKHRTFFDSIVEKRYLSQFATKQTTLLYAPTWMDMEDASTFFDSCETILDVLPDDYNMLIKLHPRLEMHSQPDKDCAGLYHYLIGKYAQKSNVVFIEYFPLVFPLLAASDVYLGDTSSIGYDFLAFDRPLFFLNKFRRNPKSDRTVFLFNAGLPISPEEYGSLYTIIRTHLNKDQSEYSVKRKELWDYTFGKERSFGEIKAEIQKILLDF